MSQAAVPRPIERLLDLAALGWLGRLALASPFLISGFVKLLDFTGATEEVAGLGLRPGAPFAAAVVLTQLGGSVLFLTRRFCWLGAGILAGFTILATLLAHPFWTFEGPDRGRQTATFFEHVAIVGGFAMAAILVNCRRGWR
jgi:transmembrane protein